MTKRAPWATSTRNKRLPNNWPQLRQQVAQRAGGKCQATHHHPQCNRIGTECDHITPGDNHHPDNLQWLNHYCHKQKTQQENKTRQQNRAQLKQRPQEKHPAEIN
ncbi:HNH endonuclease signature motif containing protein [Gleimia europaea]|nr:HNH endonuclease signature motif containing protein [Gleimia europaea]MDK8534454.1 HNH endonuclease signature motif containing protein [Gleimia europaea]